MLINPLGFQLFSVKVHSAVRSKIVSPDNIFPILLIYICNLQWICSHLQIACSKWHFSIINIILSIKKIVLQCFQIRLISVTAAVRLLMKLCDHTCMNSNPIKHLRIQLICLQILILFFQSVIIPDNILRLVQTAILQVFIGKIKTRQMISIKYKHSRLFPLSKSIYQLADHLIYFIDLIDIIFIRLFLSRRSIIHLYRILRVCLYIIVLSMTLHSNPKGEIRFVFIIIQSLQNFIYHHIILRPSIRV